MVQNKIFSSSLRYLLTRASFTHATSICERYSSDENVNTSQLTPTNMASWRPQ
jgi:hypothetical protein